MADPITDERLRYHATRSWTAFDAGTYDELQAIAAELLAARKRIVELDEVRAAQGELLAQLPPSADQLVMAEMDAAVARTERDEARAELLAARAQLREVAASGVEAETRQYVTVQIDPETWRKIQEVARG